jgi:hypothetical protein
VNDLNPCPNCGELPVFGMSRDKWYEYFLYHLGGDCPYRIEIYHHSEKECVDVWNKYIEEDK